MASSSESFSSCPYLGFCDDAATFVEFPAALNCCHKVDTPAPVALKHQRAFCLGNFQACPLYQQEQPPATLPSKFRLRRLPSARRWRVVALVVALLAIAFLGLWEYMSGEGGWPGGVVSPTSSFGEGNDALAFPLVTPSVTVTPSLTATPTSTPTVTPTPTFTPTPTLTPTPTPTSLPRRLGMPLGYNHAFLLYQTHEDDTLEGIARRYDLKVEDIRKINLAAQRWQKFPKGLVLVLPLKPVVNVTTPLMAYRIPWAMQAEDAVRFFGLPQERIAWFYTVNDLQPADWLNPGDWVILPATAP